jgi:hypothetical protein
MAQTTQEAFADLHKSIQVLKKTVLTESTFLRKLPALHDNKGHLRFFIALAYATIINTIISLTAYFIEFTIK